MMFGPPVRCKIEDVVAHHLAIRLKGYIATHLEKIERNQGFKGFNKPGIDGVLRALDPRVSERETVAG